MRIKSSLDALFPGIRQAVLSATVLQPDRWWYLSDLAARLRVTPSSLQRELASLTAAGILRSRRDGNRVYYQPDPECPILGDLQGLFARTVGLADVLKRALQPYDAVIATAFIFGSVARQEQTSKSDVDLFVVGDIGLAELAPALRDAEVTLRRDVNPVVMTREELAQHLAEGSHFYTRVMREEKFFLKGSEHDLEAVAQRPASATA